MQDYIPRSIDINQTIPTVVVKQFDHNSRFLHVALTDIDLSDGDSDAFILQDCSAALYIQPEGSDDPYAVQFVAGDVADPENGIGVHGGGYPIPTSISIGINLNF